MESDNSFKTQLLAVEQVEIDRRKDEKAELLAIGQAEIDRRKAGKAELLAIGQAEIDRRKAEKLSSLIKFWDDNLILNYIDLKGKNFLDYPFMAKDGSMYADMAWVDIANKEYNDRTYVKKLIMAKDGSVYADMAWVDIANKEYNDRTYVEEPYIAKDGSMHADKAWVDRANKEYNDRIYVKKPKFPEEPYIDTSVPPYKKVPDYILPEFNIDNPESQWRLFPSKNQMNPDDKFSK